MANKLRVLLSAYACEPNRGSEPEAGWQWATRLASGHDVTVVTRANNAAAITAGLQQLPAPHPQFIYYDLPGWLNVLKQGGLPVTWYYALWQIGVYWHLRPRLRTFDLIHHVTFNSYRWAGVWWLSRRPLVLGPLGGGQICPPRLLRLLGRAAPLEFIRSLLVRASRYNPLHRLNCRRARVLLIANQDTRQRLPAHSRSRTQMMLDAGIEAKISPPRPVPAPAGPPRLIWVGALYPRKALPLALRALARARQKHPKLRLTVVGNGPRLGALQELTRALGLEGAVDWAGWKTRAEVEQLLAAHDIFLFTSVRDTSGYVLLEAMLAGLPVITLNHQGAAEMTTEQTALRIPPTTISATVQALADAIIALAENAERRQQMGQAGRAHVLQCHTWEQRARQMQEVYAQLSQALRPEELAQQPRKQVAHRQDG